MKTLLRSRTLSISIDCHPDNVFAFVSNPENLPGWAVGLCRSVSKSDVGWTVETSQGPMNLRFVENNEFGVLDHFVSSGPGIEVYVPMRVLPNGTGSELIFTLFQLPGMSDDKFAEDAGLVMRDMETLKKVLEN